MKCANSGADARPMNMHQDPVTLTVLIVSCTAPTPKKPRPRYRGRLVPSPPGSPPGWQPHSMCSASC